jgi:endogenous inhibitor of DNA gyrase (YacG/DUF329 family)
MDTIMKIADCPVCLKEVEISEERELESVGCPLCGKSISRYMCPYCHSEFTSADLGEVKTCGI